MSYKVLFVCEGEKTEPRIIKALKVNFLKDSKTFIECVYGQDIYDIYRLLEDDPDLDLFSLLKERNRNLSDYKKNDFAEIFLFFDYDPQATKASDLKLYEMILHFNEETENGKLYISYPMIESLRHNQDKPIFKELKAVLHETTHYKTIVDARSKKEYKHNVSSYSNELWKEIIVNHLKKMNMVINNSYILPDNNYSPLYVYLHQKIRYIRPEEKVMVLNAFPMWIFDWYSEEEFKLLME